MTQTISQQKKQTNYEEDNWDDIEIPETGLLLINNENDYGLSTTTREISEITIYDSSDDDSEDYLNEVSNYNSNKSTPVSPSSPSSINKVKEMMINSGVVIANNKEEFSGLITRIRGENNKVIVVGDDWDNDIEIPEDGLTNLTINTNKKNESPNSTVTNDFEFDILDEEEQKTTAKRLITSPRELIIKHIEDPSKVFSKSNTVQNKKTLESVDDDFDFTGMDKLDLTAKTFKLHHQGLCEEEGNQDPFGSERHSSRNSSRLSILPSPAPTNGSQSALESGEDDESFDDIQFPERMESLTLISRSDNNDFENGLEINDESVFDLDQLKNKNIVTRPNPKQQKRTRRESFSIEFNTSPKNSRSSTPSIPLTNNKVHPKTTNNNSTQVSPLDKLKTNKAFSKSPTSLKTSTTKNTTITTLPKSQVKGLQNQKDHKLPVSGLVKKPISLMKNTLERTKSSPSVTNPTNNKSSKRIVTCNSSPSFNKRTESSSKGLLSSNSKKRYQQNINPNNNIYNTPQTTPTTSIPEIMRKPTRQQSFGDGTELDGFDDLPVNIDRERSYTSSNYDIHDRKNSISSISSRTDNSDNFQRHRKYKKNRRRMQPQLIKNLNADLNRKVVGEMVYNPITQRWDGNDSVLKDFDNVLTTPIRPALISNMNNHTINTKSFQVVGKMKFDPIKMCWNNDSSDEEEGIWDCDDDRDDFISTPQAFSDVSDNDISPGNIKKTKSRTKHEANPIGDNSNDFQVGSEFDITSGFLAALLASERQHRNEITRWYPGALSKKNESRFGLRDVNLQRSYLYDLRNSKGNTNYSSSGNNPKINHKNRSGGLFEAAVNLTRNERRHFR
ncbi:hypothetical protein RclHR1_13620005 [Rhizophagus clarus]|uniref:Two-component GAP Byr4 n=1 Tax=Rhizophagus clarus TaxID=94130 RepID=A0A2Z6QN00_9GLOM|nr:hypothetical protein RclHR1_13620005 [Rhizophagus clarus]GES90588.1 two-component GAP Byr4 [Rhizophagus clarus]